VVSKGLLRGKTLSAVAGTSVAGGSHGSGGETMKAASAGNVTSLRASAQPSAPLTQGAVALKAEAAAEVAAATAPSERDIVANQRAAAKAKGYEGSACPECHNFTMVRNGTCLKCDTCGSTTGCS
jgi:ribonucleoside-diphosphate reductase alpha chain